MQVIRHIVYGNQFLPLAGDNACDVFLKFVIMFRLDEVSPTFDSEHDVDINLRVGICHEPKMPLLTELENLFSFGSTKMSRLRRLVRAVRIQPPRRDGIRPFPSRELGRRRQHKVLLR
jgi:hypothetical protein